MTVYGAFSSSTLGMKSQAQALGTIAFNIANVNTGGYKATETRFSTVLSRTLDRQSDLGGVKPKDYQRIDQQGLILSSTSPHDLAINGKGFFILNTEYDGSGDTLYGRDGSFQISTDNRTENPDGTVTYEGYLIDKNGYYVQGWSPDPITGLFSSSGTLSSLQVDPLAFARVGQTTSSISVSANLPSNDAPGDTRSSDLQFYDSLGIGHTMNIVYTKSSTVRQWDVSITPPAGASVVTLLDGSGNVYNSIGQMEFTARPGNGATVTIDGGGGGGAITYEFNSTAALTVAPANATFNAAGLTITGVASDFTGLAANDWITVAGATNAANNNVYQIQSVSGGGDVITLVAGSVLADEGPSGGVTLSGGTSGNYWIDTTGNTTTANDTNDLIAGMRIADAASWAGANAGRVSSKPNANYTIMFDENNTGAISITGLGNLTDDGTATGAAVTNQGSLAATLTIPQATDAGTPALQFAANGYPSAFNVTEIEILGYVNGAADMNGTASPRIALDFGTVGEGDGMTQFAGDYTQFSINQNGYAASDMNDFSFDTRGHVVANFENSTDRNIYKLALAVFINPNALQMRNGNVYSETSESGTSQVKDASSSGFASFIPNAVEMSNVDIADEFANMIMTQAAYNSSATVFRTVDEMIVVARDLKR